MISINHTLCHWKHNCNLWGEESILKWTEASQTGEATEELANTPLHELLFPQVCREGRSRGVVILSRKKSIQELEIEEVIKHKVTMCQSTRKRPVLLLNNNSLSFSCHLTSKWKPEFRGKGKKKKKKKDNRFSTTRWSQKAVFHSQKEKECC